uniref:Uncharacterized protein n=1 Tax=Fagus sylvatica TaxID=28930 RepID=A0A2N9JAV7_FAGSY
MPELVDASDDDGVVYPVTGESLVARRALNTHIKWLNDCGEVRVDRQVLVTFSIRKYLDEVHCDVVPMYAGHILLERSWQYDRRVTHDGFKNMYSFVKGGKTIKLAPLTPSQVYEDQLKLKSEEFGDVFPEEMPNQLPPIRGIEHQIDFVPGAAIPNRPAYRSNPEETKELQRQVEDLMSKGAINNITVKYRHPIPRLDDMLDELHGSCIFSKIDLKSIEVDEEKVKAIKEWPMPKSITENKHGNVGVINEVGATQELQLALALGHRGMSPLHGGVAVEPITRARSKKIKEALNGLIQDIWADSTTGHSKLGPKEDEGVINVIQATDGADHA